VIFFFVIVCVGGGWRRYNDLTALFVVIRIKKLGMKMLLYRRPFFVVKMS